MKRFRASLRPAAWRLAALGVLTAGAAFVRIEKARAPIDERALAYYELGVNLGRHQVLGVYPDPSRPSADRGFLYPSFIAMTTLGGASPRKALTAQAALGAGLVLAVYALGAAIYSPLCGLLASAWYAFDPEQLRYCAGLGVEFFYSLTLIAVAAFLVYWSSKPSRKSRAVGLGLAIGVSIACRSPLFLLPAVLAAVCLTAPTLRGARIGWLLAACLAPLLLWIARNAVEFGRFIPFEDGPAASTNMYTGALGASETWEPPGAVSVASLGNRGLEYAEPAEQDRALTRESIRIVLSNPLRYSASCLRRLAYAMALHPVLSGLALIGAVSAWGAPGIAVTVLLVAYFWLVHSTMSVEPRFFVPITPILSVLAAAGVLASAGRLGLGSLIRRSPDERPLRSSLAALSILLGSVYLFGSALLALETLQKRDLAGSPSLFDEELAHGIGRSKLLSDRGVLLAQRGQREAAAKDFREAISIDPDNLAARLSLGAILAQDERWNEALTTCDEAVKASTPASAEDFKKLVSQDMGRDRLLLNAAAFDCRGDALRGLGRAKEARDDLESARRLRLKLLRGLEGAAQSSYPNPL